MLWFKRYSQPDSTQWNKFVATSKNATFLFDRGYMDYHSHRFTDFSILCYDDDRLVALLPANIEGDTLQSHMGLTYGGLLTTPDTTVTQVLHLFAALQPWLYDQGIRHVVYKCIPAIYHRLPAEEDLYAMFRTTDARLCARDVGSVIPLPYALRWQRVRRRALNRAHEADITIRQSTDYAAFWQVLDQNLMSRYGVHPVHSLDEITLLAQRFPDNIRLYESVCQGEVVGGVVVYVTPQVIHAQYSSATPQGKALGAVDIIYDHIINHPDEAGLPRLRYFDFGRSTEQCGHVLNEPLIFYKEGFGGRALCWDWYEWNITSNNTIKI